MPQAKRVTTSKASKVAAEMRELLGPAKVWSTDDPANYDRMYQRFAESLGVVHPIICTLIWDLVHETCEISALRRARAALSERAYQAKIEREIEILTVLLGEGPPRPPGLFDLLLAKQEEPQPESAQVSKQEEAAAAGAEAEAAAATADEKAAAAAAREQEKAAIRKQIEAVKKKRPTELDRYGAFEERIDLYERFTRQITLAMARRDALLRDIDYHQNGLGRHLGQVSDDIIIDGEVNEEPVSDHGTAVAPVNSPRVQSTMAESTIAESTMAESTIAESTIAESTIAESTMAESTMAESRMTLSTMAQYNTVGSRMPGSTLSSATAKVDPHAEPSDQTESTLVPDDYEASSISARVPQQATVAATTELSGKLIESSEDLTGSADNLAQPAVPSPITIGPLHESAEIALPTATAEPPVSEPAVIEPTVADPVVSTMQSPIEERAAEERPAARRSCIVVAGFSIERL